METLPSFYMWNVNNVSDVDGYSQLLKTLLDGMITDTASGGSSLKFSKRTSVAPDLSTMYALMQCTPDLSELECRNCLNWIAEGIPLCCIGKPGGRTYSPSCNFRYETYPFFDPTVDTIRPSPPLPPGSPPPLKGKEANARTAIIIVVPTAVVMLLVVSVCIFLRIRKQSNNFETADEITSAESLQFNFGTVRAATDNFSDANKLGKGGFGVVYRGKLSNGQEIAVKRLSRNSGQGDVEFKNEVVLVAKLQHRNLVRLLGFCLEGNERLLIYEFVPNTSLDHYIFDPMKRADLDWGMRYKIISGIVRGLLYLHEDSRLRIIHRDLKTGNILLDAAMNPKISDFGMARLFVLDQTEGSTNRIVGTYGYMAPEYAMFGQFSTKSDVFSFGVLILEIVSGQKITSFCDTQNMEYLLSYAWRNWREGTASNLIDPTLMKGGPKAEMMKCIHIGLLCVQQNVADRPDMASVVLMLNSDSVALPVPTQPASFMQSNVKSTTSQQLDLNCGGTNYEASITELSPR